MSVRCKKEEKQSCPLQQYTMVCNYRVLDTEFGGYDQGTDTSVLETNCPGDADKIATEFSYDLGEQYRHCKIVP